MANVLKISDQLSKHVYFEKRRPAGTENLYGLLHAIKNQCRIKFTYHKFWEEIPSQRIGEPYALKEFKSRWYVLLKEQNSNTIKSFALDRLTNLEVSNKTFEFPKDYNVEESYRYCFGIISPNEVEPQEIILSFSSYQGKYIKTLPLHSTQEVLIENKSELRIKLHLCITHDLVMELLSFGAEMKVLQPSSLADEIMKAHKKAYEQYR
ncbi:MAG TPA: WYL domain-containing protein [Prolixibacteraceae bacterium]|nr:WYL domain-containing protein [Prolixibacteraceae bacterium]